MKYIIGSAIALMLVSCNQGRVEQLEKEVESLRSENTALKQHIAEMEFAIMQYQNSIPAQSAYTPQGNFQQQKNFHQQRAQQFLREAEFWRQNGDEFQYQNSMRNAQQEMNLAK